MTPRGIEPATYRLAAQYAENIKSTIITTSGSSQESNINFSELNSKLLG